MFQMPAWCPSCGTFIRQSGISIQDSTNVKISGNKVSCPNCGAMADVLDGTFNEISGVLTILTAPYWSRSLLEQLGVAFAHSGTADASSVVQAAASVDPALGEVLRRLDPAILVGLAALIVSLLTWLGIGPTTDEAPPSTEVTVELAPQDRELIHQLLDDVARRPEGKPPAQPGTTAP